MRRSLTFGEKISLFANPVMIITACILAALLFREHRKDDKTTSIEPVTSTATAAIESKILRDAAKRVPQSVALPLTAKSGEQLNDLFASMDAAIMTEILRDPQNRKVFTLAAADYLDTFYARFYKQLKLSPEELAQVRQALAERFVGVVEAAAHPAEIIQAGQNGSALPNTPELSSDISSKLAEYEALLPFQKEVDRMQQRLQLAGEPQLAPEQSNALALLLKLHDKASFTAVDDIPALAPFVVLKIPHVVAAGVAPELAGLVSPAQAQVIAEYLSEKESSLSIDRYKWKKIAGEMKNQHL